MYETSFPVGDLEFDVKLLARPLELLHPMKPNQLTTGCCQVGWWFCASLVVMVT